MLAVAALLLALGCEREEYCTNTCRFALDGQCDDGRGGSFSGYCAVGTDCRDCGPNRAAETGFQLDTGAQDTVELEYHEAPNEAPPGLVLGDTCGDGAQEVCDRGPGGDGVSDKIWRTNDGCLWGWYQCPVQWVPLVGEPQWRYECREDGAYGIGCYREPSTPGETEYEYCRREGSCTCEDGTRFGEEIEICSRGPVFLHPDRSATCSTWYRVGSERYECGTWQCSGPGRDAPPGCNPTLEDFERLCDCGSIVEEPLSPSCATAVESTRSSYASLRTSPCNSRCIDAYITCIIEGDCRTTDSCSSTLSTCFRTCL